jgi:hypothetical protein
MVMNMKALISTVEPRETGYRVAQVEQDENIFAVAEGLFWVDCADDVVADQFWYDPIDETIKPIPAPVVEQPVSQGAQDL